MTDSMSESRHSRNAHRDKPVRERIEAERERAKRHEDEVATSSDDSFPASDPPSFTGVTSAAGTSKERRKNNPGWSAEFHIQQSLRVAAEDLVLLGHRQV